MNEMWLDCWTNTSNNAYPQEHPAYDEFNLHPMVESTYSLPYKPKQHFAHYNKFSNIQNEWHNNIELIYEDPEDEQATTKSPIDHHHYLSQPIYQQNDNEFLPSIDMKIESILDQKQYSTDYTIVSVFEEKKRKIFSSTTTPCLVCADPASGIHYGVHTCEGCKGFFRRSVNQRMSYRCRKINNCEITPSNRNSCQYCRLKKCFDVGMNRNASRLGRPPKHSPSEVTDEIQNNHSTSSQNVASKRSKFKFPEFLFRNQQAIFVPQIHHEVLRKLSSMLIYQERLLTDIENKELDHLTEVIINAHLQFCPCTTEKIQMKIKENPPMWTDSMMNENAALIWANWQRSIPFESVRTIFQSYPFFRDISQKDQICLLRYGGFETVLVSWFTLFDTEQKLMLTADFSAYMNRDLIKSTKILGLFLLEIFDLGMYGNHLLWTDADIALLNALLLMNPKRPDLTDKDRIEQIEAKLMQILFRHFRRHHPDQPNTFFDVLQLIPSIQEINRTHLNTVRYVKRHERRIFNSLSDIYREIYTDLPLSSH